LKSNSSDFKIHDAHLFISENLKRKVHIHHGRNRVGLRFETPLLGGLNCGLYE
jgi:hypothetical protein